MKFSEHFFEAVCDYRYLLERCYPQKSMLKLVGDRYALASFERVMLYRGLSTKHQVALRHQKFVQQLPLNISVMLDGFNVCRTVGSYLNGNPVFVGMDGYLRDVSELHRKKLKWEILEHAVDLVLDYLQEKQTSYIQVYFDTPISHSGKICEITRHKMNQRSLAGKVETSFSPDHQLIYSSKGIICTADSNIIENSRVDVFDLAQQLLLENFSARPFSFIRYLADKKCP